MEAKPRTIGRAFMPAGFWRRNLFSAGICAPRARRRGPQRPSPKPTKDSLPKVPRPPPKPTQDSLPKVPPVGRPPTISALVSQLGLSHIQSIYLPSLHVSEPCCHVKFIIKAGVMFCYICKVTNAQCTVTIGVLDSFVKASFTSLIQSMRSLDFLHGRGINVLTISGAWHGKIDCKTRTCRRKRLPVPVTIATLPRLRMALPRGKPGLATGHLIHSCTTKYALGMKKILITVCTCTQNADAVFDTEISAQ